MRIKAYVLVGAALMVGAFGGACTALSGLSRYASSDCGEDCDASIVLARDGSHGAPESSTDGTTPQDNDASDAAELDTSDLDAGADADAVTNECSDGFLACDGGCVDPRQVSNCGSCGNVCTSDMPVCVAVEGTYACASSCPSSAPTSCGGTCIDTTTDSNNCNACGDACSTAMANARPICAAGACTSTCSDGYNLCHGACVDYAAASNCGGCGAACSGSTPVCAGSEGIYSCVSGCPPMVAPTLCNGSCVDTTSTATNCKTCGDVCTTSVANAQPVCVNSACKISCNSGYTLCNGACVQLNTAANCGACGVACTGGMPVCGSNATCISGCSSGTPTLCGGTCVDTTQDVKNCKTCGNACSTNVANAQPTCSGGTCGFACKSNYSSCNGACVDKTTDKNNCGSCGNVCPSGTPNCSNSTCVTGCPANTPTLCGSTCVDTTSNVGNCNTCGNTCTTGVTNATATCVGSSCTFSCNSGYTACNGACVNEQTDKNNCGGCGSSHACPGGEACQGGACACVASQCPSCPFTQVPCCKTATTCACQYSIYSACSL